MSVPVLALAYTGRLECIVLRRTAYRLKIILTRLHAITPQVEAQHRAAVSADHAARALDHTEHRRWSPPPGWIFGEMQWVEDGHGRKVVWRARGLTAPGQHAKAPDKTASRFDCPVYLQLLAILDHLQEWVKDKPNGLEGAGRTLARRIRGTRGGTRGGAQGRERSRRCNQCHFENSFAPRRCRSHLKKSARAP